MISPRRSSPDSAPARRSQGERRSGERRVLRIGLLISLVAHVLAIAFVSRLLEPEPSAPAAPPPTAVVAEPPTGLRAVDVAIVDGAVPEPEEPDVPTLEPVAQQVAVPDSTVQVAAGTGAADDRTAADRLAPRIVEPRLWEPMILIPRDPTLADVQARIGAAVELLNDSALAETERALRARDWTVADASGGKWGISPGKLHLGQLTLPLPIWFPTDPDERFAEDMWYELDAQADRALFLESFEDRVRAIRERRDRERREAQAAGNGGG